MPELLIDDIFLCLVDMFFNMGTTVKSASFLDQHENKLRTKLDDKRDNNDIPIVNFLFQCSNNPSQHAYGIHIS